MRKFTSPKTNVIFSILLILQLTITTFAGISFVPGEGVRLNGAEGIRLNGAEGIRLTGADAVALTNLDGMRLSGAEGIVLTGAEALTYIPPDGLRLAGAESTGIQSFDTQLAILLDNMPDSSAINVFVVYHQMPTENDLNALRGFGILGGTRFRNLPMVMINATKGQIADISTLPSVRSIFYNKTFEFFTHDTRNITGQANVLSDAVLTRRNNGMPLSGRGVTVAVLDTGIDATHPDLAYGTQVIENVRVSDLQGSPTTFLYPQTTSGLLNSDLIMGHGTLVASIIAGTGSASGGYYGGMAPGARLLGISCGDASLFYVLSGIDYILSNQASQNIRVVNCSFGIDGLYDAHDPVNIATKIMHDAGICVVFSAGNRGDEPNSLNPYSVSDWVIGVGAATKSGSLSSFSSRGAAGYGSFHPTLVAPGEAVVGARAVGINAVPAQGLAYGLSSSQNDLQNIPLAYLPRYTMGYGTSFAAPHVAGTIALMLQANPLLTPDEVKTILQETATPMLGYSRYEVGAGYLNAYAAVRNAVFGAQFGRFRVNLKNVSISISHDAVGSFSGELAPGASSSFKLQIPEDTLFATVQIEWLKPGLIQNNLSVVAERYTRSVSSKPPVLVAGEGLRKTGVTINNPEPGLWSITITNLSDILTGSTQKFAGAVEIFRTRYDANLSDIYQLQPIDQQAAKLAMTTGIIATPANVFAGDSFASRLEVARAIMLGAGARVPQYLPYSPTYADLPNDATAIFVESIANSPRGNLMGITGSYFNPQAPTDRVTVAMAVVKALGLEQEAQASKGNNPGIIDWYTIPDWARGYVSVAVRRNLMSLSSIGSFRPMESITRVELARTVTSLLQATR